MTETSALLTPHLGFGLGLRKEHYEAVLADRPELGWFEVITENYLLDRGLLSGGKPLDYLDRIRAHYPMTMHGVSLSIGGSDPLDWGYLKALASLARHIEPAWVSDHLCWTQAERIAAEETASGAQHSEEGREEKRLAANAARDLAPTGEREPRRPLERRGALR